MPEEAPSDPAFLGVDRSVTGKLWQPRPVDERLALALTQKLNLPDIVARVLAARNVGLEEVESYLSPTLREMLPDPAHFLDMAPAVERIVEAWFE